MIKAAFFDIDGTLVPLGTHSMPESTVKALDRLRAAGVKVFVSSGRHLEWIDALGDYPFDGYVTCNGAMCILGDRKTEIFRRSIPAKDILSLVNYLERNPIPFVFVPAEGGIFFTEITEVARQGIEYLKTPNPRVGRPEEALHKEIVQLMIFATTEEMERIHLFTDIIPDCEPTSWSKLFADITPRNSSKAVGIAKMAEYFGIEMKDTAAFGDGENDIPMLEAAGISIAMGNANPPVKAAATFTTLPCYSGGIAAAVDKLLGA